MERKDVDRSPLSVLVERRFRRHLPAELAQQPDERIDELGVASVAESIQARSLEEHP
jgi:hypothetical protein